MFTKQPKIRITLLRIFYYIKKVTSLFAKHNGLEYAGYLSFLFMLSVFPFIIFFVAIIGGILDENLANSVRSELLNLVSKGIWYEFISLIRPRIIEITSTPPQTFLTIAILSVIWTASSIFEGIRNILNAAYHIKAKRSYFIGRFFSIMQFILVVLIGIFILIIFVIVPNFLNLINQYVKIQNIVPIFFNSSVLHSLIYYILLLLLLTYLYYFIPDKKIKLLSTLPGSIFVILGWKFFSMVFQYYLVSFPQINIIYGSIASIIITLLYLYFCSAIFICGAELNYVYSQKESSYIYNRMFINLNK